ncbi:excisionase family DNA-binding protein [Mycobacterium sp. smrl_JER01]|uniref:excisionase family DNA-binding protein n=1 Tax=Mycobacterium sp. smrl_JER01 TaxID=3402633 RepID=UPI003AC3375A
MANATPPSRARRSRDTSNRAERPLRRYCKINEAAEYLGVTTRTIRAMIADGRLTGYRSGNRLVRVDLNEIDDAMRPFGGAA